MIKRLNEVRNLVYSSVATEHLHTFTEAFAEIDWHDYAIVQTIEFTAVDANSELPPPMSVQEVENMTLAQKRMAAMIMETTAEDIESHRARQAVAEAEAAAAVGNTGVGGGEDDAEMEQSDDEEDAADKKRKEDEERQRAIAHAQALQASAMNPSGPMKIRTDYVPKCASLSTRRFISYTIFLFFYSGRKEGQGFDDDVFNLWSTSCRR
jgi:splicing factor 3A subunit 1